MRGNKVIAEQESFRQAKRPPSARLRVGEYGQEAGAIQSSMGGKRLCFFLAEVP